MKQRGGRVWFLYNHASVLGPFTGDEISEGKTSGRYHEEFLVWARGLKEWTPLKKWENSGQKDAEPSWYIYEQGLTYGPVDFKTLVKKVVNSEVTMEANLWHNKMDDWVSVYQVPELMEELNICRRKHFRAPLEATVEIVKGEHSSNEQLECTTVSAGGIGVKNLKGVVLGQKFSLKINSDSIQGPLYTKAQVVHTQGDMIGLQFIHISDESRSSLISYVKQFSHAVEGVATAA